MIDVILQVFADARQVVYHGYAHRLQVLGRAYTREQEQLRRTKGACTEDDFTTRPDFLSFTALVIGNATGALALHDDLGRQRMGLHT